MSISRKRVVRLRHVVPVTAVVMVACWSSEAASGGGLQAQGASAAPSVLVDEVNHALELQSSTIVQLDLQTVPDAPLSIHIPLDGTDAILDMEPHPVRAADFQVLAQLQDGSFLQVKPSPVQSLKGHVRGLEGSVVSASVVEDGLYATVFLSDGTRYGIEPIVNRVAMAGPQDHVVYRTDQIVAVGGRCGMDEIKTLPLPAAANGGGTNPPVPRAPCIAELACDADVEYFNMFGSISATQARIQSIVNTMNVQYETQIGLTHQITTILVRTAEPDPYTSTDSTTLLCEFITDWTNNQTAIVRDVAMLFTGKNINGGVIGQAADLGNICNSVGCCNCGPFGTNGSYCLVEAEFNGNFNCATDLAAHELGHLWNAVHCTCPGNTMNPSITCANNFSAATIADIIAFRDTVTCLTGVCPGGGPPPTGACCAGNGTCTVDTQANCNAAGGIYQGNGTVCTPNPCVPGGLPNDNCASATAIGDGTFAFTTVGSNTDGPALPASCEEGFGLAFVNDVWFLYTASCTGNATASLCGSGYDTRMAVYNAPCVGALVACNDDFCTLQSEVTFAVTGGVDYLIRVGGFGGAGTGTLVTSCAGVPIGTGACCAGNGTCTVDTQANCNAAGGTYQGDGTVCTPNPCPQPTGACCAGNGTCTVDTQANCNAAGGTYQGDGTVCTPNPCPQPTGACCVASGTCTVDTQANCNAAGGTYQGDGTVCTPNPCPQPTGACCVASGTCTVDTQANCNAAGGTYQGDGTVCTPNPCPQPTGACCVASGTCTVDTQANCNAAGGAYMGDNTACTPGLCPQPCNLPGDLNGNGLVQGDDIGGYIRAKLGQPPAGGENPACADFGTGTLNGDTALFVQRLLM